MKLRKKKAFTLTELLVVVVVIGVLSAVVLPKFNKIMETRKTTEAEEIMAAIRTEQERRCALDKRYHGEMAAMSDLVPETTTKYYAYNLTGTGVEAATTNNNKYSYTLVMPSYADGRIACEGSDCSKLNKNYPSKDELLSKSDYQNTPVECNAWMECTGDDNRPCGWSGSGTQTRECDYTTGTWSAWSDCSEPPCNPDAKPTDSRSCGCKNAGTQTRVSEPVCDPNTHTWSEPAWGACSDTRTGEECCGTPQTSTTCCSGKGEKKRTAKQCSLSSGMWQYTSWSSCSYDCSCQGDDCCYGPPKPESSRNYVYQGSTTGCQETRDVTCEPTSHGTHQWVVGNWVPPPSCHVLKRVEVNLNQQYSYSSTAPERGACWLWKNGPYMGYSISTPKCGTNPNLFAGAACGDLTQTLQCIYDCNLYTNMGEGLMCKKLF